MLLSCIAILSLLPLLSLSSPSTPSFHRPHPLRMRTDSPPIFPQSTSPHVPTSTTNTASPLLMTYYADWAPPQNMDYSLFHTIIFAFALPDSNFALAWDTATAPGLLRSLVPAAHAASVNVFLSIGGWTGSKFFSTAVSSPQNRAAFANNIYDVYNQYDLDGIDIDWEYPGQLGDQGNLESSSDAANMLEFLKVLKAKLPNTAKISAAVQDTPFAGPDGRPMKDVSAFAQVLDFVTLMNYDTSETKQPAGPNAPLWDGCGNSSQPSQTAVAGYNAWTAAGFPASQLVLGVPAYGYVVDSSAERLSSRSSRKAVPDDSGQIQFESLISQGLLSQSSDGSFVGAGGFTRDWDSCSATPYLYSGDQVIPYDDTESLGMKAAWVRKMNMGGVNLFDIHGDTSEHHLTIALRDNLMGVPQAGPAAVSPPTTAPSAVPSTPSAVPSSPSLLTGIGS
ncbi:glycoside hydrolase [Paxillus ammoniavirescens]|nr:glycoside hydrolase [Paxillus ammoniavirescens]